MIVRCPGRVESLSSPSSVSVQGGSNPIPNLWSLARQDLLRMRCLSEADTVDPGGKQLYTLFQGHCARLPSQRPDRLRIFDMFSATASRTRAFNEA